jgi:uncharacterized membrane protein YhaH (DUF805 family)
MEWYQLVWSRFAEFDGRSRRQEYWMFSLFQFLIIFAGYVVGLALMAIGIGFVILGLCFIYSLISFIPSLSVSVRRLHDTGKSGWFLLVGLIPFIGGLVLIILMATDSDPGMNEYGPNPKFPEQPAMLAWSAGSYSPRPAVWPGGVSTFVGDKGFGFCSGCGNKLKDASPYCGSCGAQV